MRAMRLRGQPLPPPPPPHNERHRSSSPADLLLSWPNNSSIISSRTTANKGNHRRQRWACVSLALVVVTFVVAQVAVHKAFQTSIRHSLDSFLAAPMRNGISSSHSKVIDWMGFHPFADFIAAYYNGKNRFCETIDSARRQARDDSLPILFNISFSCDENFRQCAFGTGNVISALYGLRLAAQVYDKVELHVTCTDAETTKDSLVLPWLMGYYSPRTVESAQRLNEVSVDRACGEYETTPIAYLYREMRYDLRRMAIALVGVPDPHHPSAAFAREFLWSKSKGGYNEPQHASSQLPNPQRNDVPIFPAVELDDAVIHFRCGDLMDTDHPNFAFLRFAGYTKYISPEAQSIGILTQPFATGGQTRDIDATSEVRDRCRLVVESFVDFIHESHPHSRVTIRNDPNETIGLAYARMIMANETIAGVSTFGVFPVMATFGKGYLRSAVHPIRRFPNKWTTNPPLDQFVENLKIVEEPDHIMTGEMKKLWKRRGAKAVLAWFRGEKPGLIQRLLELFSWPKQ
jgi:hypothetical protein